VWTLEVIVYQQWRNWNHFFRGAAKKVIVYQKTIACS
jgi:hypothetical protein